MHVHIVMWAYAWHGKFEDCVRTFHEPRCDVVINRRGRRVQGISCEISGWKYCRSSRRLSGPRSHSLVRQHDSIRTKVSTRIHHAAFVKLNARSLHASLQSWQMKINKGGCATNRRLHICQLL